MTRQELEARGRPVWTDARAGDRVSFKVMPEARGTVICGVFAGKIQVELDGTGDRVWVWESAISRV